MMASKKLYFRATATTRNCPKGGQLQCYDEVRYEWVDVTEGDAFYHAKFITEDDEELYTENDPLVGAKEKGWEPDWTIPATPTAPTPKQGPVRPPTGQETPIEEEDDDKKAPWESEYEDYWSSSWMC